MALDLFEDIIPADLTGYVRTAQWQLERNRFTLSQFLPNRQVPDLEYRYLTGGQGLLEAAQYRSWDSEAPIGKRPGVVRNQGELPPMSIKIRLDEYARLRMAAANPEIQTQVYNDGVRAAGALAARLELARAHALSAGSVVINENGVVATIDYGRDPSMSVAPTTTWDQTATAKPITDLFSWQDHFIAINGFAPSQMILGRQAWNYLALNQQVRYEVSRGLTPADLVAPADVDRVLSVLGLPAATIIDSNVTVNGVPTKVWPTNQVTMLYSDDLNKLGSTLYGMTAEALELGGMATFQTVETGEPGTVVLATKTFDPVAVWTKAAATAVPIVANPNLTMTATVL